MIFAPSNGSRFKHPIIDLLDCKSKQGKHFAFYRKNSSEARFRSSLDNHQQQEVFIPVDVRED